MNHFQNLVVVFLIYSSFKKGGSDWSTSYLDFIPPCPMKLYAWSTFTSWSQGICSRCHAQVLGFMFTLLGSVPMYKSFELRCYPWPSVGCSCFRSNLSYALLRILESLCYLLLHFFLVLLKSASPESQLLSSGKGDLMPCVLWRIQHF